MGKRKIKLSSVKIIFRSRHTAAEQRRFSQLLDTVRSALDKMETPWFLYGGSLLGQQISGRIMPWDDDIDLMTIGRIDGVRLQDLVWASGVKVVPHVQLGGWKCFFEADASPAGKPWGFPFIDIAFGEIEGGNFVHPSVWGGNDIFPLSMVLPIRQGEFEGVLVGIPNDGVSLSRQKYGNECLTSAVPPQWDHRKERWTKYPKVRVSLTAINAASASPAAPYFSVIMPVRNAAKSLARAIGSLQRQSFSNWELLAVDDASSDASVAMLRRFAAGDSRIRVFQGDVSGGPSAARNQVIREARGDWIAYLDADQEFYPEYLTEAADWTVRTDLTQEVIVFQHDRIDASGEVHRSAHPEKNKADPKCNFAMPLGVLHPRELLEKVGDFSDKFEGDWDLSRCLEALGLGFRFVPDVSGRDWIPPENSFRRGWSN